MNLRNRTWIINQKIPAQILVFFLLILYFSSSCLFKAFYAVLNSRLQYSPASRQLSTILEFLSKFCNVSSSFRSTALDTIKHYSTLHSLIFNYPKEVSQLVSLHPFISSFALRLSPLQADSLSLPRVSLSALYFTQRLLPSSPFLCSFLSKNDFSSVHLLSFSSELTYSLLKLLSFHFPSLTSFALKCSNYQSDPVFIFPACFPQLTFLSLCFSPSWSRPKTINFSSRLNSIKHLFISGNQGPLITGLNNLNKLNKLELINVRTRDFIDNCKFLSQIVLKDMNFDTFTSLLTSNCDVILRYCNVSVGEFFSFQSNLIELRTTTSLLAGRSLSLSIVRFPQLHSFLIVVDCDFELSIDDCPRLQSISLEIVRPIKFDLMINSVSFISKLSLTSLDFNLLFLFLINCPFLIELTLDFIDLDYYFCTPSISLNYLKFLKITNCGNLVYLLPFLPRLCTLIVTQNINSRDLKEMFPVLSRYFCL
ncbi:hypothetical protein RCL1_001737 [Eukaryota sp. TZLM3-RCL]